MVDFGNNKTAAARGETISQGCGTLGLMEWLGNNLIAFLALAVSAWGVWRTRHRVTVAGRTTTLGIPGPGGTTESHSYVVVTVRNIGRPIAVENVMFEHLDPTLEDQDLSWGSLPVAARAAMGPAYEMPPGWHSVSHRLEDGESVSWTCSLGKPSDPPRGKEYRAAITLANGKRIRSEPFWHAQSPEEGWAIQ